MSMIDLFAPRGSIRNPQAGFLLDEVALPIVYRQRDQYFVTRYQPALADGRRLYKYGVLDPEWKVPRGTTKYGTNEPLRGHKPVLFTTPGKAVNAALKKLMKDDLKEQKSRAKDEKWEAAT